MNKKVTVYLAGGLVLVILLALGMYGYLYASTPENIRQPEIEHYHFRTQIVVDGKPVDFSEDKFQQAYDKSCSNEISDTPIDFHDNVDQMTHIHWDGVTGGQFLKYFGWNFIGGNDKNLGYRYDDGLTKMQPVERYGDLLPSIPKNANYFIYIGDENSYQQKSWDEFLEQDLEEFFGKKSNLTQDEKTSVLEEIFFKKAYAHGGGVDGHHEESELSDTELSRINNLIGNAVIFVQNEEPTKEAIQARFNSLVELQESTCGG